MPPIIDASEAADCPKPDTFATGKMRQMRPCHEDGTDGSDNRDSDSVEVTEEEHLDKFLREEEEAADDVESDGEVYQPGHITWDRVREEVSSIHSATSVTRLAHTCRCHICSMMTRCLVRQPSGILPFFQMLVMRHLSPP